MCEALVAKRTLTHNARNTDYDIFIYQNNNEDGEYQIFVAKGGIGTGDMFLVSQEIIHDAKMLNGLNIIDDLVQTVKNDIDNNNFNKY